MAYQPPANRYGLKNDLSLLNEHSLAPPGQHYPHQYSVDVRGQHAQHESPLPSPYGNGNGYTNGHGHADDTQQLATPPSMSAGGGISAGGGMARPGRQSPAERMMQSGEGKTNRLRKACDSCSIRKVKCDEFQIPCRACAALEIPCTRDRPSRRRGPPNRHAEAIKKRRLESPNAAVLSSPSSPDNVAQTLMSLSTNAVISAEQICPLSTLKLLVDDFFTYISPLCPFPHEPSFRDSFSRREDLRSPTFLALLASMVGALVASFPRQPRLRLKAEQREHIFPNSIAFVERCHNVATQARGAGYLDNPDLNVYDAATSYFLGLSAAYTVKWRQTRLYFGETLTILRCIGAHKANHPGLPIGLLGTNNFQRAPIEPVDCIKMEMGRRLFWVMFVGVRSMQQNGGNFGELLIPPPTKTAPYPPYPSEIDDDYIFVDGYGQQPQGTISKLTGFKINCQIYETVTPIATMELSFGIDSVFDIKKQKRAMDESLRAVKRVLDNLPHELSLLGPHEVRFGASGYSNGGSNQQTSYVETDPNWKRQIQFEIQKANIYGSQLGTRSYLVEKHWNLEEAYQMSRKSEPANGSPGVIASGLDGIMLNQPSDGIAINIVNEREEVVKDLLMVLGSISQINMEPNGASFINKIRQIASTLINTPENRKGPLANKYQEYLHRFLEVLMRLERIGPDPTSGPRTDAEIEEEALRNWADLRENQRRFLEAGGFLSEIS